jgi:hypothetical protein
MVMRESGILLAAGVVVGTALAMAAARAGERTALRHSRPAIP